MMMARRYLSGSREDNDQTASPFRTTTLASRAKVHQQKARVYWLFLSFSLAMLFAQSALPGAALLFANDRRTSFYG
jgi:hypothetical protein